MKMGADLCAILHEVGEGRVSLSLDLVLFDSQYFESIKVVLGESARWKEDGPGPGSAPAGA